MNEDPRFGPIEERLQAEAERLLIGGGMPQSERLWTEWQRRRAAPRRIAATTAVLLAAVLATVTVRRQFAPVPPHKQPEQPVAANEASGVRHQISGAPHKQPERPAAANLSNVARNQRHQNKRAVDVVPSGANLVRPGQYWIQTPDGKRVAVYAGPIPNLETGPVPNVIRVERSDLEKKLEEVSRNVESLQQEMRKLTEEIKSLRARLREQE